MRGLRAGFLLSVVGSAPLLAQERDRLLEQIDLALQRPLPMVHRADPFENPTAKKLGVFTLVPPTQRGEMIRISVPIGEMVTRAFRGVAAAGRRRREQAARRDVEAELKQFSERPSSKQ
jgi:hypothetical protein